MKSPVWRAIALLTLVAVVMGMATDANAARRSALAGNYFINDADDMFAFPQLYTQYQNMAIIDFAPDFGSGSSGSNGNVSLIWGGENHSIRVSTGRADVIGRTAQYTWGGFDRQYHADFADMAARSAQFFDVGWATMLGEMPFGVGLTWLSYGFTDQDAAGVDQDKQSASNFQLQLGLTPSQLFQLALEVGFGSSTVDLSGGAAPDPSQDTGTFNIALTSRGDIDNFAGFAWRYLAGFYSASDSYDADGVDSDSYMGFRGSFGPVFGTPGEWEVAGYITLDYRSENLKGGAGAGLDEEKYTEFGFPNYNLAGEYYLSSWFVMRAGVASMFVAETYEDTSTAGTEQDKDKYYDYFWTMGFGIDKDSWGLDFALEEGEVFSGYFLNGDTGGDVFAYISAWYNW